MSNVTSRSAVRVKVDVRALRRMKEQGCPAAWVTAYDFPIASAAERAGVDMILVGDSGGMTQLGYATTNPVTMEEMLVLARAARRGAADTFLIGDMPQGSYEVDNRTAVLNALRFVKEAGCDAVKLEGGTRVAGRVRAIAEAGILVMGHLGLTPQSAATFGGYRVQGRTPDVFEQILNDAHRLAEAGAFALLLEAMPSESAGQVARQVDFPVYGIGSSSLSTICWGCSGRSDRPSAAATSRTLSSDSSGTWSPSGPRRSRLLPERTGCWNSSRWRSPRM
jgi:3-methyl-2-oxobutanoate hydroxymethyltransferase